MTRLLALLLFASACGLGWWLARAEPIETTNELEPVSSSGAETLGRTVDSELRAPTGGGRDLAMHGANDADSVRNVWSLELDLSGVDKPIAGVIDIVVFPMEIPEERMWLQVPGNGRRTFDVSELSSKNVGALTVVIDHPAFFPIEQSLRGVAHASSDATLTRFEASIQLVPCLATFKGRVTVPPGRDPANVHLALFELRPNDAIDPKPLVTGFPYETGEFELVATDPGSVVLIAARKSLRPDCLWIDSSAGSTHSNLQLALDAGYQITGVAEVDGQAAPALSHVTCARADDGKNQLRLGENALAQYGNRFELQRLRTEVHSRGRFQLDALANATYAISVQPRMFGAPTIALSPYVDPHHVEAPAQGIRVECGYELRAVEFRANGVPVESARVIAGTSRHSAAVTEQTRRNGVVYFGLTEGETVYAHVHGFEDKDLTLKLEECPKGQTIVVELVKVE